MFTLTRCRLAMASGITALFVLTSIGTAMTVTSPPPTSPDSGKTSLVAASPATHVNNGHGRVPVRRRAA